MNYEINIQHKNFKQIKKSIRKIVEIYCSVITVNARDREDQQSINLNYFEVEDKFSKR